MGESGDFMFLGSFYYTIDEKGRIIIPVKLRTDLGNEFIMSCDLDGCLCLYPKSSWNNIIGKYKQLPNVKTARTYLRFVLSSASACQLDKQGRLSINANLIEYAGIKKECVIMGVDDHLEIWGKERWNDFLTTNQADLVAMADELFYGTLDK